MGYILKEIPGDNEEYKSITELLKINPRKIPKGVESRK